MKASISMLHTMVTNLGKEVGGNMVGVAGAFTIDNLPLLREGSTDCLNQTKSLTDQRGIPKSVYDTKQESVREGSTIDSWYSRSY